MPTLLIDLQGKRKRVKLQERASIGRTDTNHVWIDHPAISRTHALIHRVDGTFVIEDAGSSNGIAVNGRRVRGRQSLEDGARITLGPAIIIFHADDVVLESADENLPAGQLRGSQGILLNCSCGARLWVPDDRIGGNGMCRQCGAIVSLGEKHVCSICQWEITADSSQTRCPACGLTFHAECWEANLGCSAYGCAQVGALAPPEPEPAFDEEIGAPPGAEPADETSDDVSWDKPLLTASLATSLLGIVGFGIPAAALVAIAAVYLRRNRHTANVPVVAASLMIGAVGVVAGIFVSGYWWLGWTSTR
jgi:hypothetical protein